MTDPLYDVQTLWAIAETDRDGKRRFYATPEEGIRLFTAHRDADRVVGFRSTSWQVKAEPIRVRVTVEEIA